MNKYLGLFKIFAWGIYYMRFLTLSDGHKVLILGFKSKIHHTVLDHTFSRKSFVQRVDSHHSVNGFVVPALYGPNAYTTPPRCDGNMSDQIILVDTSAQSLCDQTVCPDFTFKPQNKRFAATAKG